MSTYIFNGIAWPIFILILIVHLYSRRKNQINKKDNILQIVSKSLLVPILILILLINVYVLSNTSNKKYLPLIICGLFCGWIGDVVLINWKKEDSFILTLMGLAAFLIQHILVMTYIGIKIEDKLSHSKWFWLILTPFVLMPFVIWQVKLITNSDLLFKIIICIYAVALILLIGLSIVSIVATQNYKIWLPMISGSILFAISDSLLGLQIFRQIKIKPIFVMATYGMAQCSLIISFIVFSIII